MRAEDREAKREFVRAYFEYLTRRIALVPRLHKGDYENDALLLCCCYIDGLGVSLYWPQEGSARNFVRVLQEHGGEEVLWHVHPRQLIESFDAQRSLRSIAARLSGILGPDDHRLRAPDELVSELGGSLDSDEMRRLRDHVWRGTLAHLAYTRIRCQLVHGLGAAPLLLSKTTLKGQPVPSLDFDILYRALRRIADAATEVSIRTNKWFGHDFREPENAAT
jgi:hypothetical protein